MVLLGTEETYSDIEQKPKENMVLDDAVLWNTMWGVGI